MVKGNVLATFQPIGLDTFDYLKIEDLPSNCFQVYIDVDPQ